MSTPNKSSHLSTCVHPHWFFSHLSYWKLVWMNWKIETSVNISRKPDPCYRKGQWEGEQLNCCYQHQRNHFRKRRTSTKRSKTPKVNKTSQYCTSFEDISLGLLPKIEKSKIKKRKRKDNQKVKSLNSLACMHCWVCNMRNHSLWGSMIENSHLWQGAVFMFPFIW